MATRGTGGLDETPAHQSEVVPHAEDRGDPRGDKQFLHHRDGGGQTRPAGEGRWRRSARVPSDPAVARRAREKASRGEEPETVPGGAGKQEALDGVEGAGVGLGQGGRAPKAS